MFSPWAQLVWVLRVWVGMLCLQGRELGEEGQKPISLLTVFTIVATTCCINTPNLVLLTSLGSLMLPINWRSFRGYMACTKHCILPTLSNDGSVVRLTTVPTPCLLALQHYSPWLFHSKCDHTYQFPARWLSSTTLPGHEHFGGWVTT